LLAPKAWTHQNWSFFRFSVVERYVPAHVEAWRNGHSIGDDDEWKDGQNRSKIIDITFSRTG